VESTSQQIPPAPNTAHEPARGRDDFVAFAPSHTQTQSTLAPTAEFTRIFLLAWIIRYVFRGASGTLFEQEVATPGIRNKITDILSWPGRALKGSFFPKIPLKEMEAATYAGAIGLGSGYLSYRYSKMVRSDIQNIFSEAVAFEQGKPQDSITFNDITQSDNRIVRRTVENYRSKFFGRIGTDASFFVASALRNEHLTDLFLGLKGVQIFADTWKRKTTMFEDLITFINNKINPRNGLGQAISTGDIFDLYQHYAEAFTPGRMFKNVLEGGGNEGALWAKNQPIFQRMAELMNLTYAYKHRTIINAATGAPVAQANFALPTFIYLLGHDLIDVQKPTETLLRIEVANQYGIGAVQDIQRALAQGATLDAVAARYPITPSPTHPEANGEKNGVLPKGSTMQLARDQASAPSSAIQGNTIHHDPAKLAALHPATQHAS
jgi:hypothetical protein